MYSSVAPRSNVVTAGLIQMQSSFRRFTSASF